MERDISHGPRECAQLANANGSNGNFEVKDLPAGTHKFRVWQERAETLEKSLEVKINPRETTEIELSYGAEKFAHRPVVNHPEIVLGHK